MMTCWRCKKPITEEQRANGDGVGRFIIRSGRALKSQPLNVYHQKCIPPKLYRAFTPADEQWAKWQSCRVTVTPTPS